VVVISWWVLTKAEGQRVCYCREGGDGTILDARSNLASAVAPVSMAFISYESLC